MSATTIDQQFIEYIVKTLVGKPDAVKVERSVDEKGVLLELTVDQEDIGRVIGKRGSTAQSLRALLRALGTKNDARYNLKIVDVDRPEGERGTPRAAAPVADSAEKDTGEAEEVVSVESTEEPEEKEESDLAKKTRAELADLDDLDI